MPERRIVGFRQDAEQQWVAELECGHAQHVRHEPPWQIRPWVVTPEGRASRLGTPLVCQFCHAKPGPGSETMPTIDLHPMDDAALAELSEAPARYAAAHGFDLGAHGEIVQDVARQTRTFVEREGITQPWGGYLVIDAASRALVGTCAYKGPPDPRGEVEVAYFTFPMYEGRGYATAMAAALRDRAVASPAVRCVRAHTLPERNASGRLLEKLGFRWAGEVHDPEDGLVWRWEWEVPR